VAQEQKLIEKHAKAAGVDAKVEWIKLSGGSAVNDALLSGNIEIAAPAWARCSRCGTAPRASRT
jgi:ABC-type nitrate/sulfonate/bicarbonate transport system substrate-binding protein